LLLFANIFSLYPCNVAKCSLNKVKIVSSSKLSRPSKTRLIGSGKPTAAMKKRKE